MGKSKKQAVAPTLTSEQIAALLALLAGTTPAPTPAPAKAGKAKPKGDVVASASGFTFAWTREKVKNSGAVQYRLVITRGSKTLTRDAGYPYAVREENGTLAERVASAGVPKFAMGLATSLAK
jgi:hypothetical protein